MLISHVFLLLSCFFHVAFLLLFLVVTCLAVLNAGFSERSTDLFRLKIQCDLGQAGLVRPPEHLSEVGLPSRCPPNPRSARVGRLPASEDAYLEQAEHPVSSSCPTEFVVWSTDPVQSGNCTRQSLECRHSQGPPLVNAFDRTELARNSSRSAEINPD